MTMTQTAQEQTARQEGGAVLLLPVEDIRPNPRQPRQHFAPEALAELAESIRQWGVLQPLTVRRGEDGWELVAGERRLRAARLAGLAVVPCLERQADETASALLALVENLQRRDLHYLEEAEAIAAYLDLSGETQAAAARKLGMSAPALANKLRLLRLNEDCREVLRAAELTERHARCLLRLEDGAERLAAARHMAARRLNAAQAERYVQQRLEAGQQRRRTFVLKDVRLFLNSLERGLSLVREAGVDAVARREDTEDAILLTIRIPKRAAAKAAGAQKPPPAG